MQQWEDRRVMEGQRRSFSGSISPGHLDSLAIVMGTWGFSCLLEGQAVPFHSAIRDPGDSACQGMVLSGASNC